MIKAIKYLVPFILLSGTSSCAQEKNKETTENMENYSPPLGKQYEKNPDYSLQVFSSNCTFALRVNDVVVFKYMEPLGGFTSLIPLNGNILASGKQEITVQIMPKPGEAQLSKYATFKIEVRLYKDVDDPVLEYEPVLSYELKVPEEGMPATIFKDIFMAEVPYTLEGWKNSKDLSKEKNIGEEVYQFYKEFQTVIKNKDENKMFELIKKREKEIAQAFYFTEANAKERLDFFKELINTSEKAVSFEEARLNFYGNGRIVNLEMPNGSSALQFEVRPEEEEKVEGVEVEEYGPLSFSLMLHKPKGSDKLEIIR